MQTTESMRLVEDYLAAIAVRDLVAARAYLSDIGFHYVSPIAAFGDPNEFLASMEGVGAILHDIRIVHRFADDRVVCHVLDVTVSMAAYKTQRVVQLARVRAGKITHLEVIFDATEFHRMVVSDD